MGIIPFQLGLVFIDNEYRDKKASFDKDAARTLSNIARLTGRRHWSLKDFAHATTEFPCELVRDSYRGYKRIVLHFRQQLVGPYTGRDQMKVMPKM